MPGRAVSNASDIAGGPSMMTVIHKICTALKGSDQPQNRPRGAPRVAIKSDSAPQQSAHRLLHKNRVLLFSLVKSLLCDRHHKLRFLPKFGLHPVGARPIRAASVACQKPLQQRLSPQYQYRNMRVRQHMHRFTAHQQPLYAAPAMGRHHYQITFVFFSGVDDGFSGKV